MPEIDRSSEGPKNIFKGKLFATLIASTVIISFIATMLIASVPSEGDSPARITYEVHNPILINNSADFASQAFNESWLGDGTSGTPYIIQGYDISASSMPGIQIFDSDVYFIVKDCYIHDGGASVTGYNGIYLDTCTNGALINNICSNNNYGVLLWDCSGSNAITNNTCSGNYYGIYLESSSGTTLTNNTCNSNVCDGLHLPTSNYCTVSYNNCSSNGYNGIYLYELSSNIISNNTCRSNTNAGIWMISSSGNTIWNNTFYHNNGAGDSYDAAHIQASDDGTNNHWNSTNGYGNWWSDWTGPDVVLPLGIVDKPYNISGSAGANDSCPLTTLGVVVFVPEFSDLLIPMAGLTLIALVLGRTRRKLQT